MNIMLLKAENTFFMLLLLVIMLLSGCGVPMSEIVRDKSVGLNGSFEHIKSGLPVNWLIYTPQTIPTGDYDLVIDTTEYKAGKQSLKFLVRECAPTGGWHSPGIGKEYNATPGDTYKISFWIKNDGCEFLIGISGVTAFEGEGDTIIKSNEAIDTWQLFEYNYTMPAENKFDRIRFEMSILHPGSFWIDEIKIEGVDGKSVIPTAR